MAETAVSDLTHDLWGTGRVTPWLQDADVTLYHGGVLETLRELPAESVDCVVTSPPYWGLRDYGTPGQLGLEPTPEQYVERMVEVFREVRRVLAAHGTVWLNLGDSYNGGGGGNYGSGLNVSAHQTNPTAGRDKPVAANLKPKDLVGIPWRVAFALQADGWYLRSDIIWAKPNPMPESVTDRPTKAHEYVFLLSKQPRYFFDQEAVREPHTTTVHRNTAPTTEYGNGRTPSEVAGKQVNRGGKALAYAYTDGVQGNPAGRNIRSVWEIATQPYPEAHFATFPEELARRCIAAGCPEQACRVCGKARERVVERIERERPTSGPTRGGSSRSRVALGMASGTGTLARPTEVVNETRGFTDCECWTRAWEHSDACTITPCICKDGSKYRPGIVLDPFMGSGTVAFVARKLGRHSIGIDLNESYLELAARRLQQQSLLTEIA